MVMGMDTNVIVTIFVMVTSEMVMVIDANVMVVVMGTNAVVMNANVTVMAMDTKRGRGCDYNGNGYK